MNSIGRNVLTMAALAVVAVFSSNAVAAGITSLYPEPLPFGQFSSGWEMAVADFNGDGMPAAAISGSYDGNSSGVLIYLDKKGGKYAGPAFYEIEAGSKVLAAGDLNGDGYPDIVVGSSASYEGDQLSVLINNGDGTFGAVTNYSPHPDADFIVDGIAVGDATGDGKSDVVVGTDGGLVYVVPGYGNGDLNPDGTQTLTSSGSSVDAVAVTDLDGDGRPDVVAASITSNVVDVFQGLGGGEISPTPTQSVPTVNGPTVAIADVNGDGEPDIIAAAYLGNAIQVLLNNGGILTNTGVTYSLPLFSALIWVRTADLDGDSNTDILVSGYTSDRAGVLYGNGDGSFEQPVRIPLGAYVQDVAATDTDGDGRPDLVSLGATTIVVARNLGHRKFSIYQDYSYAGESLVAYAASDMASADFNGDGRPDVATANSLSVSVLLNDGNGGFLAPNVLTAAGGAALAVGDVNGDGKADIATGNGIIGGNNLVIYPGNGDGTFASAIFSSIGGAGGTGIALGDVDGDGLLDAVALSHGVSDAIEICRGAGTGNFDCGVYPAIPVLAPNRVKLVDLNGDGNLDLIVTTYTWDPHHGGMTDGFVYLGDGHGGFGNGPSAILPVPPMGWGIAVDDVNGDGNLDVAITSDDEIISVFPGNGDGTFGDAAFYGVGFTSGGTTGGAFGVLADVNADAMPDIIASTAEGPISVLINQGDGTFSLPFNYAAGDFILPVVAVDMNGDDLPDIVAAAQGLADDTYVSVYLHNRPPVGDHQPVARDGTVMTTEGKEATGRLDASSGDDGLFSVASLPVNGTIDYLDVATGVFSYLPYDGYTGADSFTFRVTDWAGGVSNVATETISVKAAEDGGGKPPPPSGGGDSASGSGGGGGGLGVLGIFLLFLPLIRRFHRRFTG